MFKSLFTVAMFFSVSSFASSLTVREIKLLGQGKVEIALDGAPVKGTLELDYVRDIVQFSIQNATIYPAKILHADESTGQAFNKVFAYQYAPNLVRVRFSVAGQADQFKGKVKWEQKGKNLFVSFPAAALVNANEKKEGSGLSERSLLAKVMGQSAEAVTVEKIEKTEKVEKIEKVERAEKAIEEPKRKLTGTETAKQAAANPVKLGGASPGPTALRSFLAMFLIVGGLGCVLLYVKKKKNSTQAKKVGDSWISNLMSGAKKSKALIEVLGSHALGPKQSITIVRIRGQQLVLGVTEGNVQLITQLDSDEEIDLFDDPKIADSIGKIFGGKPVAAPVAAPAPRRAVAPVAPPQSEASFNAMLKGSTGAGAIVARNAYQSQSPVQASIATPIQNGVRSQIKQRLQGMRNA